MKQLKIIVGLTLLALSLTACGGGGDSTPAPTGSSEWDTMVWDQDDWS